MDSLDVTAETITVVIPPGFSNNTCAACESIPGTYILDFIAVEFNGVHYQFIQNDVCVTFNGFTMRLRADIWIRCSGNGLCTVLFSVILEEQTGAPLGSFCHHGWDYFVQGQSIQKSSWTIPFVNEGDSDTFLCNACHVGLYPASVTASIT
jgi:hypothetical protein